MENVNKRVAILMSTYNGERFIEEQINSIIHQDYHNWTLYIRDDGSADKTKDIIRGLMNKDKRIILIDDIISHRGIRDSFLYLLQIASADYYMFCDQDDIWLDTKISMSLLEIISAENKYGHDTPLMVCSDLKVVEESLKLIHSSLWEQNHVKSLLNDISNTLQIAPLFPGCTMFFNNIAKDVCLNHPAYKTTIHDNHLAFSIIAHGGYIVPIRKALILYRQHAANVLGAYRGSHYILSKFRNIYRIIYQNYVQFKIANYYLKTSINKFVTLKLKHLFNYK